jgi:hypothetical protein
MVKKFFSGVLHVEKISLNKLQQIPVIEARWHFYVFVFSKPLFNVGNPLKFVLSDVVPAKKHCSFVVVALNIDKVIFRRFYFVGYQRWHVVGIFTAVEWISGVCFTRLLGKN